jgi:hypothetical protein
MVSGLTMAGAYAFNVAVSDGTNTSIKQLYLAVYSTNPPPVLGQTGFRMNAPYGLVFGDPSGTTRAVIEQPTSSATLQAGIADLANSDFTGRGTWSLVSQPPGASAGLSSTTYIYVSLRANVINMTVPGDYVFQINVTNPGHPDLVAQIICTVNPASSPPVISSITATPSSLTLPASLTQLSAVTSGSTNQPLRHWWAIKSVPAGAYPQFDHQGLANTTVSNLLMPGSYTFTLRTFDDLHMTTLDKTITVAAAAAPGAPVINSAAASVIVGAPFAYTITATGNPTSFSAANLPPGLMLANGVISGTPRTVGTHNIQLAAANTSGTGYGNLVLTVKLPLPAVTSPATADGLVNTAFFYTVQATGVAASFSAAGLPPGLALNSLTGAITGTNTNAGTFNVIITAANSTGQTTDALAIIIYNSAPSIPVITSALAVTANLSASFNYVISAANYPTSFFAIGLPPGLLFDPASGRISGIPSMTGNFSVTLRALNRGGTGSANLALSISPEPPPEINSTSMQNGFAMSFLALTNRFYTVEWIANLFGTNWTPLTNEIPGNGTTITVVDLVTNAPARFYRLQVSP